jgi:hypothetical protein
MTVEISIPGGPTLAKTETINRDQHFWGGSVLIRYVAATCLGAM